MTAKKPAADKTPAEAKAKPVVAGKAAAKPAPEAKAAAAKPAKAKAEAPAKADAKPAKGAAAKAPAKAEKPAKGAKGKVDAKKTDEEDLGDIEADFIEPEAEVEAVVEEGVVEKVKPLRMKVSRAKERALMREFGLDETTLSEEEVAKRRLELKTLIKMGKTRGFLTHQEINDHLPEKLVDNESSRPSSRCSMTWASRSTSRPLTPPPC